MIKRFTSRSLSMILISCMLVFSLALPAIAQEPVSEPVISDLPLVKDAPLAPDYAAYDAQVKEVMTEDGIVTAILAIADGNEERFNIFSDTAVINNETGAPTSLKELVPGDKELVPGDKIFVYGSLMKTRSLPPQSTAFIVLTDIDVKAPAKFVKVMSMEEDAAGNLIVFDANGEYTVNITEETVLRPYRTKQIVTKDDIKAGANILVWSEIMTLSLPAQMTADMVVLLPEEQEPSSDKIIISLMAGVIAYNGQEITPEGDELFYDKNDTLMIPLRKVCETLGYEVKWVPEGNKIELHKEGQIVKLQIGSHQYNDVELAIAPELTNSITFVPTEFLAEILNYEVSINSHHV